MLNLTHLSHFFHESYSPEPIIWSSIMSYISKFVENCFVDNVSLTELSSYCHFFGIAIVSSRNRVFFTTFLLFESIYKISVRHTKIIHICGIRQRNILCFTSLFSSRFPEFNSKFIFPQKLFFRGVISFTE